MNNVLIGNIISLGAALLMVLIGFIRSKKNILKVQCAQFGLYAVSNFILGGYTGSIANIFSIVRNLRCVNKDISIYEKLFYILAQIVCSALLNTSGLLGWLPVAAACVFTLVITTKNEIVLKLVCILGQIMWTIYDFNIKNYVSFAFDIATVISNIVGIFSILKLRKSKTK